MEVANQEPHDEEEHRRENPEQEPHALVLGRQIAELFFDDANVVYGLVLKGKIWKTRRINERVTFIGLEAEVRCSQEFEFASFRERILNKGRDIRDTAVKLLENLFGLLRDADDN